MLLLDHRSTVIRTLSQTIVNFQWKSLPPLKLPLQSRCLVIHLLSWHLILRLLKMIDIPAAVLQSELVFL